MKPRIALLMLVISLLRSAYAGDKPTHPPEEHIGKWSELRKLDFKNWRIKSYDGSTGVFDGGSWVCSFTRIDETGFSVMIANPSYWTAEDKRLKRQVFYLLHEERFFLISSGSTEEKILLQKLSEASADNSKFGLGWNISIGLDKLMKGIK